jgi:hypothetical protein
MSPKCGIEGAPPPREQDPRGVRGAYRGVDRSFFPRTPMFYIASFLNQGYFK